MSSSTLITDDSSAVPTIAASTSVLPSTMASSMSTSASPTAITLDSGATSTPSITPTVAHNPQSKALTGGAIAGIVVGCVVFVALVGGLIYFLSRRRDTRGHKRVSSAGNAVIKEGRSNTPSFIRDHEKAKAGIQMTAAPVDLEVGRKPAAEAAQQDLDCDTEPDFLDLMEKSSRGMTEQRASMPTLKKKGPPRMTDEELLADEDDEEGEARAPTTRRREPRL